MKYGNKKVFLHKDKLYQLINLRLSGIAYASLAVIFNVDRTSISYQCDKYLIEKPIEVYSLERIIAQVIPPQEEQNYKVVNGEKINLGKSYKDYLELSPYKQHIY